MKNVLKGKQNVSNEFKEQYHIDFDILFDPSHPKFEDFYSLEKEKEEVLLTAIKFRTISR